MSGWTFAFQVVNFLILALVLRRFLFKPVAAMVARRQGQIEATARDAESAKRAAEESRTLLDAEGEKIRTEREGKLAEARAELGRERDEGLARARSEAGAILEGARAEIARQRTDAVARLADEAVELAIDLARRLLEQAAGPEVCEILLQRACDHLENLPKERLRSLREE